jgi:urease accessory protein
MDSEIDMKTRAIIALFLVVAWSHAASAHVGAGGVNGFVHGFSHPLNGIDHVLAMVAVGAFAAHLGGQALWLLPLTFISVLAVAGFVGMVGINLPLVEIGIGLSVVVLGLVLAFQLSLPIVAATVLVGFFAIFHGYSHGAEMPESASGLAYGGGFVCATVLLHAIGIGLGIGIERLGKQYSQTLVQVGGSAMALTGIAILAGFV